MAVDPRGEPARHQPRSVARPRLDRLDIALRSAPADAACEPAATGRYGMTSAHAPISTTARTRQANRTQDESRQPHQEPHSVAGRRPTRRRSLSDSLRRSHRGSPLVTTLSSIVGPRDPDRPAAPRSEHRESQPFDRGEGSFAAEEGGAGWPRHPRPGPLVEPLGVGNPCTVVGSQHHFRRGLRSRLRDQLVEARELEVTG